MDLGAYIVLFGEYNINRAKLNKIEFIRGLTFSFVQLESVQRSGIESNKDSSITHNHTRLDYSTAASQSPWK